MMTGPRPAAAGYPPRYHRERRAAWGCAGKAVLIALGALAVAGWAVYGDGPPFPAAVALTVGLLGLLGAAGGLHTVYCETTVHPYFEREVGGLDTFGHGHALARVVVPLDRTAEALGVPTVSSFGWNDDLAGEALVWHPAAEGLRTFVALRDHLRATPGVVVRQEAVMEDIDRHVDALQKADAKGIRFCLLLRMDGSTSGHEWEVRKGTAF